MTRWGSVGGGAGIQTFLFLPSHTTAQLGLDLHRSEGGGRSGVEAREEMGISLLPLAQPSESTHPSARRIVEEVRSIRFNQEQEEELLNKYLSLNLSVVSGSSLDIRDMTYQQDLITALINREKVRAASLSYPASASPPRTPRPA